MADKTDRKPVSARDLASFQKDQLALIKKLGDDVLRTREKLRTKTGAYKQAQQDLYNGLAEGLQMELRFGSDKEEEGEDDEPENLSATG